VAAHTRSARPSPVNRSIAETVTRIGSLKYQNLAVYVKDLQPSESVHAGTLEPITSRPLTRRAGVGASLPIVSGVSSTCRRIVACSKVGALDFEAGCLGAGLRVSAVVARPAEYQIFLRVSNTWSSATPSLAVCPDKVVHIVDDLQQRHELEGCRVLSVLSSAHCRQGSKSSSTSSRDSKVPGATLPTYTRWWWSRMSW
jgi:hypothetical protein